MGQRPSAPNNASKRQDSQSATDMTATRHPPSSAAREEEQSETPPDAAASMDNPADQLEWSDCDVPIYTPESKTQDETPPEDPFVDPNNPFVYDGARPANITKRKNIILFGETGVGKSSVINLMAGADVARTSSNLEGCTLQATEYTFALPSPSASAVSFRIYDTVGLNESEMGVNTFFGAIEKAHALITSLHDTGGIDLLLFCIRGGRITATMQRNYRLFVEFLCEKKVPLAFIVTHLEYEEVMESWWERNAEKFEKYGIRSVAHACVTATPARVTTLAAKRAESRTAIQKMLQDALGYPDSPYVKDVRSWFVSIVEMLRSFLKKSMPVSFRRRYLMKRLETRCTLSRDDAQQLADMLG